MHLKRVIITIPSSVHAFVDLGGEAVCGRTTSRSASGALAGIVISCGSIHVKYGLDHRLAWETPCSLDAFSKPAPKSSRLDLFTGWHLLHIGCASDLKPMDTFTPESTIHQRAAAVVDSGVFLVDIVLDCIWFGSTTMGIASLHNRSPRQALHIPFDMAIACDNLPRSYKCAFGSCAREIMSNRCQSDAVFHDKIWESTRLEDLEVRLFNVRATKSSDEYCYVFLSLIDRTTISRRAARQVKTSAFTS